MKVLVSGADGQLGYELLQNVPLGIEAVALGRTEFDITKSQNVIDVVKAVEPSVIINAAAYTAVDKAETDSTRAYAVNADALGVLAEACVTINAKLIHVSTDFVFDGIQGGYNEASNTNPLGVYGASKLAGEHAIQVSAVNAAIIRTAWVYSAHGNNFVKTMLRLMAEKEALSVVSDQRGTPTWAKGLAKACWALAQSDASGIYHYTDEGECSWYEFACEIQRQALELGLLKKKIPIRPIPSESYPTPAKRPANSVLNTSRIQNEQSIELYGWQSQLSAMLGQLV